MILNHLISSFIDCNEYSNDYCVFCNSYVYSRCALQSTICFLRKYNKTRTGDHESANYGAVY